MKLSKITISGQICTGKTTLFLGLQEKLIWPTFPSSQYFREYARIKNLSLEKAEEQSKKLTKKVDYRVAGMLKSRGNLLVEGWMAGIMANDYKKILKILLVCDDKIRIERFSKREKVSLKEAKKRIESREDNLLKTLKRIHKRDDFLDKENYNLIIDTGLLGFAETVGKVLDKLGYPAEGRK